MRQWDRNSLIALLGVLLLGVVLALLDGTPFTVADWGIYTVWLAFTLICGFTVFKRLGGTRQILWVALTAFLIRIVIGVTLTLVLPVAGYQDSEVSQAGYVFKDAFVRDRQAWKLSISSDPINLAFGGDSPGDQYGGMLALSAWIYRYVSPDSHRPYLIIILTAAVSTLAVLWVWKAAQKWFTQPPIDQNFDHGSKSGMSNFLAERVALLAAWIMALYPESILLGSSQMREPIIIALIALAFQAFTKIREPWYRWSIELGLAVFLMFVIQPPIAFVSLIVLIVLIALEPGRRISWKTFLVIILLTVLGGFLAAQAWQNLPSLRNENPFSIFFLWLQRNFSLQTYMLERVSGWSQRLIQQLGEGSLARLLVVLVYGAAQPVLPAALVVPGAPIWRVIGTLRATGWYLLFPLIVYSLWVAFRWASPSRRIQRIWLGVACVFWTLIAAANGGADQWDNPRYRTMFLVWLAVLAAWTWWWSKSRRDPWLGRIFTIEGIFLLVFIEWYLGRYYPLTFIRIDIWVMIAITLVAGVLILGWGWVRDRKMKR